MSVFTLCNNAKTHFTIKHRQNYNFIFIFSNKHYHIATIEHVFYIITIILQDSTVQNVWDAEEIKHPLNFSLSSQFLQFIFSLFGVL